MLLLTLLFFTGGCAKFEQVPGPVWFFNGFLNIIEYEIGYRDSPQY